MLLFTGYEIVIPSRHPIAVVWCSKEKCAKPVLPRIVVAEPHGNRQGVLIVKHSFRQSDKGSGILIAAWQAGNPVFHCNAISNHCVIAVSGRICSSVQKLIVCQKSFTSNFIYNN